ncbi:MAG TPA: deoxyribonuclease V [Nitrosospira sp.]|nr:deoxyribonuclease V [Nitrosospira sp.]
MTFAYPHNWRIAPHEAIGVQERLRSLVETSDRFPALHHVAGVDVFFDARCRFMRAAVAVLSFPTLELIASATAQRAVEFPYIPGLFAFRELPAVLDALAQLQTQPDLILYDGHGIAHPRRFGIASHLGVLVDRPTVGIGKTRLIGREVEPPRERGNWVALKDGEEVIGAIVRTQTGVKPIYVSIGHRVSLAAAVQVVLACTTRYRLPETTREAHRLACAYQ